MCDVCDQNMICLDQRLILIKDLGMGRGIYFWLQRVCGVAFQKITTDTAAPACALKNMPDSAPCCCNQSPKSLLHSMMHAYSASHLHISNNTKALCLALVWRGVRLKSQTLGDGFREDCVCCLLFIIYDLVVWLNRPAFD